MSDRHPPRTWPDGTEPPADAFVDWIRAHDPAQLPAAVEVVARILEGAHRGQVCLMADHESYPETLHHLHAQLAAAYRQADRFRAAWRSARRRGVWRLKWNLAQYDADRAAGVRGEAGLFSVDADPDTLQDGAL